MITYISNITSDAQTQFNLLSTSFSNITNYQPQINTLSSIIYNIPNYQPQINSISSLIYNIPNYQPQINSISSLIYQNQPSSLLPLNNVWTQFNTFSRHLRLGDRLFFGGSNDSYIGYITKQINDYKLCLVGSGNCCMGYLNNEQQLIVDKNGITINSGYISLSGSILTSITVDRLKNISSDVQLQINTVNSTITSTDNSRKTYIDNADAVLNTRITTTDADQKTYIDEAIRLQSLKFVSGDIIQAKALSSRSSSLTNSTINSTVVTEIFSYNFTPKSTNSSIYASFDCYSEVNGSGIDSFETTLVIGNTQVGYKNISFSNDQRNHSIILFPISGHCFNLSLNVLKIYVTGRRMSSDDNLVIYGPSWVMYITEIQN
jgi:hypothetical protein